MLNTALKITPKANLSTKLKQTISLFGYSYDELLEEILKKINENPFLEMQEPENLASWQNLNFPKSYNNLEELPETSQVMPVSLKESLYNQLLLTDWTLDEKSSAYTIIDSLEDNGYLKFMDFNFHNLEEVRKKIQNLEPLGCASISLQEYLLLQLKELKSITPYKEIAIELVANKINLLERHAYDFIMEKYNLDATGLKKTLKLIQTLKQEPYTQSDNNNQQYPDLYITNHNSAYEVMLYEEYLPKLSINKEYLQHVNNNTELKALLQEATWFIDSINQRQSNLLHIGRYIIAYQKSFLEQGLSAIKPLTLKQVAKDLNLSISTISRLTSKKYIATKHGLLALKKFFSTAYNSDNGNKISANSIKTCIANLFKKNNNLLSDKQIAIYLHEYLGITISRRTVAKYRNQLHIPPALAKYRLH